MGEKLVSLTSNFIIIFIVRIKSLLDVVGITATHVCVNTAQMDLVVLMNFKENVLVLLVQS